MKYIFGAKAWHLVGADYRGEKDLLFNARLIINAALKFPQGAPHRKEINDTLLADCCVEHIVHYTASFHFFARGEFLSILAD